MIKDSLGILPHSGTIYKGQLLSVHRLYHFLCIISFCLTRQLKSITHYTVGKDSQGDCIYFNPDIIKIGIFQIIMENKNVLVYSKLSHRQWVQIRNSFTLIPSNYSIFKSLLSLLELNGEIIFFLWQEYQSWLN